MKIPAELLGDHLDPVRAGGRGMQMERRPNFLAHHGQANEDHRRDDGPENLQAVVPVRVNRAPAAGGVAIFPNHPSQTDLSGGKSHADHDDRDHELAGNTPAQFTSGFRETPAAGYKTSN